MKKLYALLAVLALLLPVLAGCQNAEDALAPKNKRITATETSPAEILPPETIPAVTPPEATPAPQISHEEALNIALKDAGLEKTQITDLDIELDWNNGTLHYDVDFEAAGYDYDYDIHAETGKILKSQKERD
jgi:uncharacterized membrane protein YkoI